MSVNYPNKTRIKGAETKPRKWRHNGQWYSQRQLLDYFGIKDKTLLAMKYV